MSYASVIAGRGFSGKLMFDVMGWNGDGNTHRVTRYSSVDPAVISAQLGLIKLTGAAGVRVTWQGPKDTFIHQATLEICNQCVAAQMLFALLINPQVNGQPNWWNDPGFLMMMNSPTYIPEKYLSDFSTGIDYSQVTLPAGVSVLHNQSGFGWVNAQNPANNAAALQQIQNTNRLSTMKWPFLSHGYFDGGFPLGGGARDNNAQVWNRANPYRVVEHEAGNFFLDCVDALSLCPSAPYCGMVWNDADEGAGVEHFLASWFGWRLGK